MVEPSVNRGEIVNKPIRDLADAVVSKTIEYYLAPIVPFELPIQRRLYSFLDERLKYFDPNEMERASKKPFLNIELIKRRFAKKDLLGAYEAFWGTWNPVAHRAVHGVYNVLGGNRRPKLATAGAFLYSGFVHATHPIVWPAYAYVAISGNPGSIPVDAAKITAFYCAVGLPVLLRKIQRKRG